MRELKSTADRVMSRDDPYLCVLMEDCQTDVYLFVHERRPIMFQSDYIIGNEVALDSLTRVVGLNGANPI